MWGGGRGPPGDLPSRGPGPRPRGGARLGAGAEERAGPAGGCSAPAPGSRLGWHCSSCDDRCHGWIGPVGRGGGRGSFRGPVSRVRLCFVGREERCRFVLAPVGFCTAPPPFPHCEGPGWRVSCLLLPCAPARGRHNITVRNAWEVGWGRERALAWASLGSELGPTHD